MRILASSFVNLVYPFKFAAETFRARVEALDGSHWLGRAGSEHKVWGAGRVAAAELLPHVGHFVRSKKLEEGEKAEPDKAYLWDVAAEILAETRWLGARANWQLHDGKDWYPFHIDGIGIALFPTGVGLMTVHIKPPSKARRGAGDDGSEGDGQAQVAPDTPAWWLGVLHYARFAWGQRDVSVTVTIGHGADAKAYFPEVASGPGKYPERKGFLGDLTGALLTTARLPEDPEQWREDIFVPGQCLAYAGIFADEASPADIPGFLYRFRNMFPWGRDVVPATSDLDLRHPGLLPYAHDQWFVFSLEGGGFFAANPPATQFFRETLPGHVAHEYCLLFTLALHQRFALMALSETVAASWDPDAGIEHQQTTFDDIEDALLTFTARGNFTQVMQREHHHACYRKWRETFQIDELYREVSDEVRHMHQVLETHHQQQILTRQNRLIRELQRTQAEIHRIGEHDGEIDRTRNTRWHLRNMLLTVFAIAFVVPSLVLGYFDAVQGRSELNLFIIGCTAAAAGLALGAAIIVCFVLCRGETRQHRIEALSHTFGPRIRALLDKKSSRQVR